LPSRLLGCGSSKPAEPASKNGHRVPRVRGKGGKIVLVRCGQPSAERSTTPSTAELTGPILRSTLGTRMDRHAATRRLKRPAATAGVRMPRMLRHTSFVTTMLDAGVRLRDVQTAAATLTLEPPCATTAVDERPSRCEESGRWVVAGQAARW
jgi:hypothetical protein